MGDIISESTKMTPIPPVNEGPAFVLPNNADKPVVPTIPQAEQSVPNAEPTFGIRPRSGVDSTPAIPNPNLMPEPASRSVWDKILRRSK